MNYIYFIPVCQAKKHLFVLAFHKNMHSCLSPPVKQMEAMFRKMLYRRIIGKNNVDNKLAGR
jgi:hypothetical protein